MQDRFDSAQNTHRDEGDEGDPAEAQGRRDFLTHSRNQQKHT